jgi:hypothetical protein
MAARVYMGAGASDLDGFVVSSVVRGPNDVDCKFLG